MVSLTYMEVETRFAKAAFRVNDLPVWGSSGIAQQGAGICLNGLLHGRDRLEVRGTWLREDKAKPEGLIRLNVGGYEAGDTIGLDGEHYFDDQLADAGSDDRIFYSVDVQFAPEARWSWMSAISTTLPAPGANAFVAQLLQAFREGDAGTLFEAMKPALADRAIAFPEDDVDAFMARLRPGFSLSSAPGDDAPILSELVLESVADGRLIEVLDRSGQPFVRKRLRDGRDYRLPLLIGRRGSAWEVFR